MKALFDCIDPTMPENTIRKAFPPLNYVMQRIDLFLFGPFKQVKFVTYNLGEHGYKGHILDHQKKFH